MSRDDVRYGKVVAVGLISLAIFALGTAWSVYILRAGNNGQFLPPPIPAPQSPEIGLVDRTPFEVEKRATQLRTQQLQRLRTYGWADRERRRIHIPIDMAMEKWLAERKQ